MTKDLTHIIRLLKNTKICWTTEQVKSPRIENSNKKTKKKTRNVFEACVSSVCHVSEEMVVGDRGKFCGGKQDH